MLRPFRWPIRFRTDNRYLPLLVPERVAGPIHRTRTGERAYIASDVMSATGKKLNALPPNLSHRLGDVDGVPELLELGDETAGRL
jgi:hypothetical protein